MNYFDSQVSVKLHVLSVPNFGHKLISKCDVDFCWYHLFLQHLVHQSVVVFGCIFTSLPPRTYQPDFITSLWLNFYASWQVQCDLYAFGPFGEKYLFLAQNAKKLHRQ